MRSKNKRTKLITSMSTSELIKLNELLEGRIVSHIYEADEATSFRTPFQKLITIALKATALRLLADSYAELRKRKVGATKTP